MSAPPKSWHVVARIEVRTHTIFVCTVCGVQARGSTAAFDVQSVEGLQAALDAGPSPRDARGLGQLPRPQEPRLQVPGVQDMTRINCIPVKELTDAHLGAEYRELPRVFGLVARAIARGETPDDPRTPPSYVLCMGHVRFFYNKIGYVANRYYDIVAECRRRGRVVNHEHAPPEANDISAEWWGQWTPTPAAMALNRARINDRLQQQKGN